MNEMWVPIVLFVAIAFVFAAWIYYRYRSRSELQRTVQVAIDKGQELSPELLDRLGQPRTSGHTDLRRGMISVGLGIAFAIFALVLDEDETIRPLLGLSAFPFVLGVTYLGLWQFAGNKND